MKYLLFLTIFLSACSKPEIQREFFCETPLGAGPVVTGTENVKFDGSYFTVKIEKGYIVIPKSACVELLDK